MTTSRIPIVDKNGKATHVHKNTSGKGSANRVANLLVTPPREEPLHDGRFTGTKPIITVSPTGRNITVDGHSFSREFSYINKRSPKDNRINVKKLPNDDYQVITDQYKAITDNRKVIMTRDELIPYIEKTYGGEYYAFRDAQRIQNNEKEKAIEFQRESDLNVIRERILELAGVDKEIFEEYLKDIYDDGHKTGYSEGKEEGYNQGREDGYRQGELDSYL